MANANASMLTLPRPKRLEPASSSLFHHDIVGQKEVRRLERGGEARPGCPEPHWHDGWWW